MKKQQLEYLIDQMWDAAEYLLNKNSEFYPIAGVLSSQGVFSPCAFFDNHNPVSTVIYGELEALITSAILKNDVTAGAIAANVILDDPAHPKSDAVRIDAEHVNGLSVTLLLPYQWVNDKLLFSEPIWSQKEPKWFNPTPAPEPN